MIVGYNEAHFLGQCLESVSFCDEIVYTDLGSTDSSVETASIYTDKIRFRDRKGVPSCEIVQSALVDSLKNDWVMFIDPDETLDPSLGNMIMQQFFKIAANEKVGAVMVPWQFYFRRKKLKGTVWGGLNKKYLLVNRHRFRFAPIVHYGRQILPGFEIFEVHFNGQSNVLHHFWMNSFAVFLKKHLRYLKKEGCDQFNNGIRVSKRELLLKPFDSFYYSFFVSKGYKDGITGFLLSLFWAYYKTHSAIDVFRFQRKERLKVLNGNY